MGTIVRLVIASIILTTTSIPTYASGQASDPDLKVGGEFFVLRPTSFPTHAPRRASFDCAVAKTPIERLICADSHLSDLDLKMGVAFDEGTQQEMHGSLMADQRDWLKKRLTDCSVPAKGEVKATTVREMTACLIKMYEERIRFLSGEVLEHPARNLNRKGFPKRLRCDSPLLEVDHGQRLIGRPSGPGLWGN